MSTPVVSLGSLASQINAKHEQCMDKMRGGLLGFIEVGRLLCEARERIRLQNEGRKQQPRSRRSPHISWAAWVEENCSFSRQHAASYMRAFKNRPNLSTAVDGNGQHDSVSGLKTFLRSLDGPVADEADDKDDGDEGESEDEDGDEADGEDGGGFEIERNWRIEQGDCLDLFEGVEDESVRLIFTDPPYNIGIDYGDHFSDSRPADEFDQWCQLWLAECFRKLTSDGSLWLLVNHEWARTLCMRAEDLGFHLRQWITWYESFGVNTTRMFNRCSRPILWLVKDAGNLVFDEWADQIRRKSDREAIYGDPRANPGGKLWDDVWGINPPIPRVAGTHSERIEGFPTQLPMALVRPIVACASRTGDLVLDPFSGSGTTGAVCVEMERRFIGFEMSEEFADMSRQRLITQEREALSAT